MKKIIIGTIGLVLGLFAGAQSQSQLTRIQKTVPCGPTKEIFGDLVNNYKELPFWMGEDEDSRFIMLFNEKTKTWTFLQFDDKTACVLGSGGNHRRVFNGPEI